MPLFTHAIASSGYFPNQIFCILYRFLLDVMQQWRSHVQCDGHKEKSEELFEKMRKREADLLGDDVTKQTEGTFCFAF